ncbi:MAG: mechanosensitive ion channel family protein [Chloroflexi bacterium]|nr:mechanosensitive ion channel family protein [Chloroflexota bacterium]
MKIPADLQERLLALFQDPILPILLIVLIAAIFIRIVHVAIRGLIKALLDRESTEGTARELSAVEIGKRTDTLDSLGTGVARLFIALIAGVMILGELGLNIGPAVAGLGVVGIAVGFGAQSLVRDYLNGALILIENQFAIGDVVTIAGASGTVEEFSLRRTTLRDLSGVVHTVPNGEIRVASNSTRTWARINEHIQVAYSTDLERAIEVVDRVGREMYEDPEWRRRVMEAPSVLRVQSLDESGVTLKVTGTVRASEQWAAAGELRRRLLVAFNEAGIEIPFPHRVMISRRTPAGTVDGTGAPAAAEGDDVDDGESD